jgi:hypothetical protein
MHFNCMIEETKVKNKLFAFNKKLDYKKCIIQQNQVARLGIKLRPCWLMNNKLLYIAFSNKTKKCK